MHPRFAQLPDSLAKKSKTIQLGGKLPALLVHPDWRTPAPCVLWFHGRTAHKELDSGRYLRWLRAGIATCAIDLPGHGERFDESLQQTSRSLDVVRQAINEVDRIVAALLDPAFAGAFDHRRMGIGGMSAGGMVVLRRLCDPHPFAAAAVEGTTGSLTLMPSYQDRLHAPTLHELDPITHLSGWRPIPLLALHSEKDEMVPVQGIREFTIALGRHLQVSHADPSLVQLVTWPDTGATHEHLGFGRVSNDAKNLQTAFFQEHLARKLV